MEDKKVEDKVLEDRRTAARVPAVVTCVYCGHAFPSDTPTHGSDTLTAHIKSCGKHPLRKAEATIAMLRSALAALVGVDGADMLKGMERAMRALPAGQRDREAVLGAVRALQATLPESQP